VLTLLIPTICTDDTLPIERTEPATTQAKHDQDEQWYARVNSECECDQPEMCGDKYRAIVQAFTAVEANSGGAQLQRYKLNYRRQHHIKEKWQADSRHYSKQSATCDHKLMPTELLPRMGNLQSTYSPDKWPYVSQSTTNAVSAMRCIRGWASRSQYWQENWHKLQARMEQYATTGAGTVAEAIVVNDYLWTAQLAHEKPSGAKSKAMKCRYSNLYY
jgi:hypothetical protein